MKNGWQKKTLRQLCQLISGQHIDAKDYNTESRGLGYLTGPSDFGSLNPTISKWTEYPKVKAKSGDILITVKGSGVGKINLLAQSEVAISRQLMAVRVIGAEPRFIYAFLSSTFEHFQALSTGAAIPGISRSQVLELEILIPSLPEQQRIVGILDEAFEGIATAKANDEKNLQNARALFESHLHSNFTQRGKGWVEKRLGELAQLKGRIGWRGLTAKEYTKRGPLFLSVHSLNYGDYVDFRDAFHISDERYDESPEIMLQKDDVLICKDGAGIGKCGIVGTLSDRTTINSSLLLIRSGKGILPKFLYRCLCSPYFQKIVYSRLNGATTPHLYQRDITEFPVFLPPLPEQHKIVIQLDAFSAEIQRLEFIYQQKLAALDALKKSLLHQAFSGQL